MKDGQNNKNIDNQKQKQQNLSELNENFNLNVPTNIKVLSIYNNKEKLISPKFSKKKTFWQTNYNVNQNQSFDQNQQVQSNKSNTFSILGEQRGNVNKKNKKKGDKNEIQRNICLTPLTQRNTKYQQEKTQRKISANKQQNSFLNENPDLDQWVEDFTHQKYFKNFDNDDRFKSLSARQSPKLQKRNLRQKNQRYQNNIEPLFANYSVKIPNDFNIIYNSNHLRKNSLKQNTESTQKNNNLNNNNSFQSPNIEKKTSQSKDKFSEQKQQKTIINLSSVQQSRQEQSVVYSPTDSSLINRKIFQMHRNKKRLPDTRVKYFQDKEQCLEKQVSLQLKQCADESQNQPSEQIKKQQQFNYFYQRKRKSDISPENIRQCGELFNIPEHKRNDENISKLAISYMIRRQIKNQVGKQ